MGDSAFDVGGEEDGGQGPLQVSRQVVKIIKWTLIIYLQVSWLPEVHNPHQRPLSVCLLAPLNADLYIENEDKLQAAVSCIKEKEFDNGARGL